MRCHYCGGCNDGHYPGCPKNSGALSLAMEYWKHGYSDGRRGKVYGRRIDELSDPSYEMGWKKGSVAREESEKGGA